MAHSDKVKKAMEIVAKMKEKKAVNKNYHIQYNVGKIKYAVSFHDGVKTHNDGSPFYDLATFKNKKDLGEFMAELKSKGYVVRYAKGGRITKDNQKEIEKEYLKYNHCENYLDSEITDSKLFLNFGKYGMIEEDYEEDENGNTPIQIDYQIIIDDCEKFNRENKKRLHAFCQMSMDEKEINVIIDYGQEFEKGGQISESNIGKDISFIRGAETKTGKIVDINRNGYIVSSGMSSIFVEPREIVEITEPVAKSEKKKRFGIFKEGGKVESENLTVGDVVKFIKKSDNTDIINAEIIDVNKDRIGFINLDYQSVGRNSFSTYSLNQHYNIEIVKEFKNGGEVETDTVTSDDLLTKSKLPTDSQVDEFLFNTDNTDHYLYNKVVADWDDEDFEEWNEIIKKY